MVTSFPIDIYQGTPVLRQGIEAFSSRFIKTHKYRPDHPHAKTPSAFAGTPYFNGFTPTIDPIDIFAS
jgi:hypothetical protein